MVKNAENFPCITARNFHKSVFFTFFSSFWPYFWPQMLLKQDFSPWMMPVLWRICRRPFPFNIFLVYLNENTEIFFFGNFQVQFCFQNHTHFSYLIEIIKKCLKVVSAIFINFLLFHQMIALQKLWRMFFISSKKLFLFSRYLIFCISVLPSFSTSRPLFWRMIIDKS